MRVWRYRPRGPSPAPWSCRRRSEDTAALDVPEPGFAAFKGRNAQQGTAPVTATGAGQKKHRRRVARGLGLLHPLGMPPRCSLRGRCTHPDLEAPLVWLTVPIRKATADSHTHQARFDVQPPLPRAHALAVVDRQAHQSIAPIASPISTARGREPQGRRKPLTQLCGRGGGGPRRQGAWRISFLFAGQSTSTEERKRPF